MSFRDQKTLLVSRDALMIKESAFKVFRWKDVANGSYDTVISLFGLHYLVFLNVNCFWNSYRPLAIGLVVLFKWISRRPL